ncbi:PREDICTED: uncharacterized protein LOC107337454, partial [Acropora digitifera]|uniref:uncharacterized protein LOC107337454 n=1 Tax=Acropora digitifera TaxID=70779 RepID=UPI00077AD427
TDDIIRIHKCFTTDDIIRIHKCFTTDDIIRIHKCFTTDDIIRIHKCFTTDDIIRIHKCFTTDDIIRIHKGLCKQLSSTSEVLKIWFLVHWFLLAILVVIFVAEMVSLFKYASHWFLAYEFVLWTIISLYVFVYPNYCASSVTARCNKMLKDLNMTTDDEWQTGHPLCNRSQLTLFLQYAQFTNCGYRVGDLTFGSSLAWFSTLIAISGLAVKLFTDDIIRIHKCFTTDDIIRIHKGLCKQLSSTSEVFKIWFVVHWFLLAILVVIFVAEMVSLFKYASHWFLAYQFVLWTIISLYVFVYPNYCASSVTARCNKMLKDLNMTTDDEWQTGHPLCNRSELTFFLQYAQFTNCGYRVGDLTFGSSLAWFSTLIAISGLAVKLF